jgi:hypothetical protein
MTYHTLDSGFCVADVSELQPLLPLGLQLVQGVSV